VLQKNISKTLIILLILIYFFYSTEVEYLA